MSNHAAIAAVTATLTNMLQKAVDVDDTVAGARVTARPPDRARHGAPAISQINLFLYRTAIDAAWRNHPLPPARPGESAQPPLPLILSYLVTAYGENDDEILSHRLLGLAMGVLNDHPVLSRADIRHALKPALGSALEDQVERVRITPDARPQDEISRMWATFGTGYRLSVIYDAAVVLIESTRPPAAPLPVLARGSDDRGPEVAAQLAPVVQGADAPNGQPAARPGDTVTLRGRDLDAVTHVLISGMRLDTEQELPLASAGSSTVTFLVPEGLPAGTVALVAAPEKGLRSNAVPLALAPVIDSAAPLKAKLSAAGTATLKLKSRELILPGQTLALLVGNHVFQVAPLAKASRSLTFTLTKIQPDTYTLRLRVDSVDSIPLADPSAPAPLRFDPNQQVVLS
jgi:hypothetical protein